MRTDSEALKTVGRAEQAPGPWAIPRRERAPLSFYLGALLLILALVFAVTRINDEPGRSDPAQLPGGRTPSQTFDEPLPPITPTPPTTNSLCDNAPSLSVANGC